MNYPDKCRACQELTLLSAFRSSHNTNKCGLLWANDFTKEPLLRLVESKSR